MHYWIKRIINKSLGTQSELLYGLRPEDRELISRIRSRNLTYLSNSKLGSLVESCRNMEERRLPGIFIEAGCALGGSTILISSLKDDNRPLYVYDVFGMIPPPTEEDSQDVHDRYEIIKQGQSKGIGKDNYYGYENNLYEIVQSNLKKFGIDQEQANILLVKGLLQDTMKIDQPVSFAHIDVDWYEPVKTCLERIVPNLVVGGILILDDYHDWSGCRKATNEYFGKATRQFRMDDSAGSMKITRIVG
jgi:Macrocin-O-methyltransferase (TylF)